jgi:lysophospholipid acyltransferase (LPLAT)-like uncharacterized protein
MKLRNPRLIRVLALLGAWLVRGWMRTIRYRYAFPDGRVHPTDVRRERFIYALWHESMLFAAGLKSKIYALASQHADGEIISQVCRHLGAGVVRGSSTRGGSPALLELLQCSRQAHLLVTPDGPRGPRRHLKLGIILLASSTGLPIAAAGIGFTRAWRARSWDRFAVPRPGSTATCVVAPPIHVPPKLDKEGLLFYRRLVEQRFLKATAAAENWARTGKRPDTAALWYSDEMTQLSA